MCYVASHHPNNDYPDEEEFEDLSNDGEEDGMAFGDRYGDLNYDYDYSYNDDDDDDGENYWL